MLKPLAGAVLTASDTKAAECASDIPLDELMEHAGRALAEAALRFGAGRPVAVLCGPGNNGGDGYVAARRLRERGVPVTVHAAHPPQSDLARQASARWDGERHDVTPLAGAVVIDALFGTGLCRPLAPPLQALLSDWRRATQLTIAADLPSGVQSDSGAALGAAGADITIALGVAKPAHFLQPAAALCGSVLLADLGLSARSPFQVLARPSLRAPGSIDHKYSRGMVAVVPGAMAGAATLGVSAAAHLAGYTVLCGKGDAPAAVVRRGFEATLADPKLGALVIGPGLADTLEGRQKLDAALASDKALVLDAGALALLDIDRVRARTAPTVLTPHEGEFVRLFGALPGSKLDRALAAARLSGAVVLLKGADSVAATPDGRAVLSPAASPWLATAGTGDVLAGMIGGLLSGQISTGARDTLEAVAAAMWLHSEAARLCGPGLIADDLLARIPAALQQCL